MDVLKYVFRTSEEIPKNRGFDAFDKVTSCNEHVCIDSVLVFVYVCVRAMPCMRLYVCMQVC